MTRNQWLGLFLFIFLGSLAIFQGRAFYQTFFLSKSDLPTRYDLRVQHRSPDLRVQAWGTCWIFATYAAMESDLIRSGVWKNVEEGRPNLAVYHLDKYSGFTRKGEDSHVQEGWYSGQGSRYQGSNTDDLTTGLVVHLGGDYKASATFLTRTKGAVQARLTPEIPPQGDHQLFGDLPDEGVKWENDYTYFFPRQIEWLSLQGSELEKRERVKREIMKGIAVASSQVMDDHPIGYAFDGLEIHAHLSGEEKLNHAINLIGWDDEIEWNGHRGAWLAQDSDHKDEGTQEPLGYFYVLYDDVYTAKDDWMGAVSFRDVVVNPYHNIYSHALHGPQYSTGNDEEVRSVAVRFSAQNSANEWLEAVGLFAFSATDRYRLKVMDALDGKILAQQRGSLLYPGFHLIELQKKLLLTPAQDFYLVLELDSADYSYDAPFEMEVALGLPEWGAPVFVNSQAKATQGYALNNRGVWVDFHDYHYGEPLSSSVVLNAYTTLR